MDPRVTAAFPFLTEARVLFVLPQFAHIHDGHCHAQGCPQDNSVIAEATSGEAREAGDIYECPCYAVFQLEATGEVFALCNWDYRD